MLHYILCNIPTFCACCTECKATCCVFSQNVRQQNTQDVALHSVQQNRRQQNTQDVTLYSVQHPYILCMLHRMQGSLLCTECQATCRKNSWQHADRMCVQTECRALLHVLCGIVGVQHTHHATERYNLSKEPYAKPF